MRVVATIQARMGSTRLPGKVLLDLGGETVLARVVRRLRHTMLIDEIVIATTRKPVDDAIVEECRRLNIRTFRGEEDDVLDRYYHAAREVGAEAVVRITSDCPLIDPEISDSTIRAFLEKKPDYASNTQRRTYPRGLDTEIVTFDALARAWRDAKEPYERVHVTPYFYQNPGMFRLLSVEGKRDHSDHRWTLDTPEDLAFIRAVYERLGNKDGFSWNDVLELLSCEPALLEINREVLQKALHEC